jgi:hypothetical protein
MHTRDPTPTHIIWDVATRAARPKPPGGRIGPAEAEDVDWTEAEAKVVDGGGEGGIGGEGSGEGSGEGEGEGNGEGNGEGEGEGEAGGAKEGDGGGAEEKGGCGSGGVSGGEDPGAQSRAPVRAEHRHYWLDVSGTHK